MPLLFCDLLSNTFIVLMFDLDRLRAFVIFAEHLNFTHAARALNISQPALHAQIRKLSDELDVVLYHRAGRALSLTPDGVRVACFGRELLARVHEFTDELHDIEHDRPVVLIAGEGAYLYLLGQAIEAFVERQTVRLRLFTGDRADSLKALRYGVADLAVAVFDVPPDDIHAERLASVPLVLVVPDDDKLAGATDVSVRDMHGYNLVMPPPERRHRQALDAALSMAGVTCNVTVEASGWPLILHFVSLGLGAAVVNGCCRLPAGFSAVPIRDLAAQRYYLLRRNGPMTANVQQLRDLLIRLVGREHATMTAG